MAAAIYSPFSFDKQLSLAFSVPLNDEFSAFGMHMETINSTAPLREFLPVFVLGAE